MGMDHPPCVLSPLLPPPPSHTLLAISFPRVCCILTCVFVCPPRSWSLLRLFPCPRPCPLIVSCLQNFPPPAPVFPDFPPLLIRAVRCPPPFLRLSCFDLYPAPLFFPVERVFGRVGMPSKTDWSRSGPSSCERSCRRGARLNATFDYD